MDKFIPGHYTVEGNVNSENPVARAPLKSQLGMVALKDKESEEKERHRKKERE